MALLTEEDVLKYWFGDDYFVSAKSARNNVDYIKAKMPLWFGRADPEFDAVQRNSVELLKQLEDIHNTPNDWSSSKGVLAKIIVFDQFARSIFRGTPGAFQYDQQTKECVDHILRNNWFISEYNAIERLFIIIALQHHESMDAQTTGVALAKTIADNVDNHEDLKCYFENLKGFPHEHHDVIKQFGRFPGRNAALGRESTEEELDWLASPDCPAWAKSQMKST